MAKGKITDLTDTEGILTQLSERTGGGSLQPSPPSPQGESSPPIGETYHRSLDDAATLLINILSPAVRDYLFEMADVTLKIPRWQLVLGSVLAQYESGNTAAPSIDPSWRDIEIAMGRSVCGICGVEFTPKRYGQLFCSQKCGDEKRKQDRDTRNKLRDEEEEAKKKFIEKNPEAARLMGLV